MTRINKTINTMKANTITIELPAGFIAESIDPSGVIKLKAKPKDVLERIKTVADVIIDNDMDVDDFEESCAGLEPDERAYRILKLVAKSLNEGWTPDWSNSSEYKYIAWFEMKGSSGFRFHVCDAWFSTSSVGSRICFKTRALAEHAGKYFLNEFKQFMIIE